MTKNIDKILHFMFFCHRIPERSFFIKGKQFPICARCTGILVGYFIGIIYLLLTFKHNLILEIVFMIPLAIDGIGQYLGYWISNNKRRFLTGILAGISTICILRFTSIQGLNAGRYMASKLLL